MSKFKSELAEKLGIELKEFCTGVNSFTPDNAQDVFDRCVQLGAEEVGSFPFDAEEDTCFYPQHSRFFGLDTKLRTHISSTSVMIVRSRKEVLDMLQLVEVDGRLVGKETIKVDPILPKSPVDEDKAESNTKVEGSVKEPPVCPNNTLQDLTEDEHKVLSSILRHMRGDVLKYNASIWNDTGYGEIVVKEIIKGLDSFLFNFIANSNYHIHLSDLLDMEIAEAKTKLDQLIAKRGAL